MSRSVHLLIIDPQNDFCDLPAEYLPVDPLTGQAVAPALPVPGAHADMQRLARFVDATAPALSAVTVTLDSHPRLDIAHPTFWRGGDGRPVAPFTPITASQVRSGAFQPRHVDDLPRTLSYLDELEARGRYTLMVWPVHCEIGTWGHNVHPDVRAAYGRWEDERQYIVRKVPKGANPWTEHYSACLLYTSGPTQAGRSPRRIRRRAGRPEPLIPPPLPYPPPEPRAPPGGFHGPLPALPAFIARHSRRQPLPIASSNGNIATYGAIW